MLEFRCEECGLSAHDVCDLARYNEYDGSAGPAICCEVVILCEDNEAEPEPDDDGPKSCPDCERPNQFGELCGDCIAEIDRINARHGVYR